MTDSSPFYITTPIYYVNDKPHVGHCYTTLVADAVARFMRAAGRDVFFLTGTDEHAEKVVSSAAERSLTPIQWADRNAAEFQKAFAFLNCSHDDFIRTTQDRHTQRVRAYIQQLLDSDDIYLGEYEGWYDPSQEEYLTETTAREHNYKSPVTGRDLIKRTEKNYFFRLSKYQDRLRKHIEEHPECVQPEARRNEVLGRLREPLQDVPVSRGAGDASGGSGGSGASGGGTSGAGGWGILMPGDESHRVYVWIDALFNYLSTVDTDERRRYWPAQVHLIAKDILWFHAVIWPCMLMALEKPLPGTVYSHSFWIREGRKMSKSLGNFLDLPTIEAYCRPFAEGGFGIDAFRWYLLTQGPLGATDADFAHEKFVEVYNADLANGIGNAASRVSNMIAKYFEGLCPVAQSVSDVDAALGKTAQSCVERAFERATLAHADPASGFRAGADISNAVDEYIALTAPFKLAKDPANMETVGTILYQCAEALRIAAVLMSPAMPNAMADLLKRLGQQPSDDKGRFSEPLEELCKWGRLQPGTRIEKGEALFPRWDADRPVPTP